MREVNILQSIIQAQFDTIAGVGEFPIDPEVSLVTATEAEAADLNKSALEALKRQAENRKTDGVLKTSQSAYGRGENISMNFTLGININEALIDDKTDEIDLVRKALKETENTPFNITVIKVSGVTDLTDYIILESGVQLEYLTDYVLYKNYIIFLEYAELSNIEIYSGSELGFDYTTALITIDTDVEIGTVVVTNDGNVLTVIDGDYTIAANIITIDSSVTLGTVVITNDGSTLTENTDYIIVEKYAVIYSYDSDKSLYVYYENTLLTIATDYTIADNVITFTDAIVETDDLLIINGELLSSALLSLDREYEIAIGMDMVTVFNISVVSVGVEYAQCMMTGRCTMAQSAMLGQSAKSYIKLSGGEYQEVTNRMIAAPSTTIKVTDEAVSNTSIRDMDGVSGDGLIGFTVQYDKDNSLHNSLFSYAQDHTLLFSDNKAVSIAYRTVYGTNTAEWATARILSVTANIPNGGYITLDVSIARTYS